jgi:hypothetical protein
MMSAVDFRLLARNGRPERSSSSGINRTHVGTFCIPGGATYCRIWSRVDAGCAHLTFRGVASILNETVKYGYKRCG